MIICVCRRLNERAVQEAISAGASSPEDVQAHHGCAFNCGRCRPAISDMLGLDEMTVDPQLGGILAAD